MKKVHTTTTLTSSKLKEVPPLFLPRSWVLGVVNALSLLLSEIEAVCDANFKAGDTDAEETSSYRRQNTAQIQFVKR